MSDLLNVWGRVSAPDGTTFIVFTHEDAEAGLSAIGYPVSDQLTKVEARKITDQPITIFRFSDGYKTFNFSPLSQEEIAFFNLPAEPEWLKFYGPQGNPGRAWRDDPALVGKFHPGYPDDIEALFFFPEHGNIEKMWVGLVDIDEEVGGYIGKLLNTPNTPSSLTEGSRVTIRTSPGEESPIYISETTRKNLQEWQGTCQACGFDLIMVSVADFVRKTFPSIPANGELEMFTMRCALCHETMGVQKRKSGEAQIGGKKSPKKWWRFW